MSDLNAKNPGELGGDRGLSNRKEILNDPSSIVGSLYDARQCAFCGCFHDSPGALCPDCEEWGEQHSAMCRWLLGSGMPNVERIAR